MFNIFDEYDSVDELARSIADLSPVFMARRQERDAHGEGAGNAAVRKNVNRLTATEKADLVRAIKALEANGNYDR
ncbi:hypothetical protein [Nocardia nepalensis]|uniref:hypothetical protein n=1 Tax=Nocardia nepalensis TaxID=3375448 RepID=UPI003B67D3A5